MATTAQLIARRLAEAGCRYAFGIPGGEVLTLMAALEEAGISFVLAKHENSAGFMAEGAHHATGAPGLLLATLGPGAANATNVIANAYQDRVPLIFLTGCVDAAQAASYTHQVIDHAALMAPITKASLRVEQGAVGVTIDKALAIALDGQPGPVHVDVPIGLAIAEQPESVGIRRPAPAPAGPAPSPELEAARELFRQAERPLMIAGLDVLNQGGEEALATLVRKFRLPLLTTYKAKGVLDEDDSLCLGGVGLSPRADELVLPFVHESDLVILAGYDPIEMRSGWCQPWAAGQPVIEFSAVANSHYVHLASHSFVGDVAAGLEALAAGHESAAIWPGGQPAALARSLAEAFPGEEDWGPAAVIDTLRRALPPDGVATADTGAHRILLSQMWRCPGPRQLLQSTAFGTMGCALPLALGYKLAQPERPVVAFVGDAGLEMVLGELATARDLGLAVVVVVFVDEQLALIELKQRRLGHDELGVAFGGSDFAAVAQALGGTGATAGSRDELAAEVERALGRDSFTVIACPIERRSYDGRF
ncbi:MAG TPA: thiamine pyrophosphate-binding protein [Alphaproteobacteria bacterium]|jgi:acetolactate synthase-1/2/3 large subunit|nr:thiamine pyrophosphate-binding protein [Alphaproteobacteria bacterium]MDP7429900.1 thiamine pyrophosphate-binding protein [Alphaproteobacteria bacterium]HJM51061.1 thiamine pyrophosphate-binding protein [Alphaproteobacteria bacterium]